MTIVRELETGGHRAARRSAALALVAMSAFFSACGGGGRGANDSGVAAGEADSIEVEALNYEVSPERYERWLAAQRALDAVSGLPEPPALDPTRFSEADVDRAVRYLESDARARAALARAGLSARDYVLTTLALDQALVATASAGAAPSGAAAPGGTAAPPPARGPGGVSRPRTRTRLRNVPPRNTDLVERRREDIARTRTGMRFRIVKERVDTVDVDRPAAVAAVPRVVPAGTTVALRSDARVCTNTHRAGDRVTATVAAPVAGTDGSGIPAGASAALSFVGSARPGSQSAMQFALNSISFDGRTYTVSGTGVASRVERVRAGSASRDAQKVVGGAAVGAVAGQVIGRDTKSTVIGAAVGAAAGAAAAEASARYHACVPAGTTIQVTLREALNLRV
jgi:hypothetical protein